MRALTNRHTHRQTDGTDFIPSTADAGGNEIDYDNYNNIHDSEKRTKVKGKWGVEVVG